MGAVLTTAYEVWEVNNGGRCEPWSLGNSESSSTLDILVLEGLSRGSIPPCRSGLNVDMLENREGLCVPRMSGVCGLLSEPASLNALVSPSRSSSASSRITPSTRRTMLPTAISLG